MAAWRSSVDSGVNPVIEDCRFHIVEVRGRVDVRIRVGMKVMFRG